MQRFLINVLSLLPIILVVKADLLFRRNENITYDEELEERCSNEPSCIKSYQIQYDQCATDDDTELGEQQVLDCLCDLSDSEFWNDLLKCGQCSSPEISDLDIKFLKDYYCSGDLSAYYSIYSDQVGNDQSYGSATLDSEASSTIGLESLLTSSDPTPTGSLTSSASDSETEISSESSTISSDSSDSLDSLDSSDSSSDSSSTGSASSSNFAGNVAPSVKVAVSSSVIGILSLLFL
ncbi:uncharacterized protein ASCRUDRAFT_68135 [Ascoidea rubescens DSM 1968]|uniref:Uncharacterized protein n=1 Tax=Ascoidea rubescens DSM 1968 TaxID=1344418 RepID=A0A1D2VR80_9ASCO|nr:hypothetical protein ASCRUDRAFT_68135 [Ascoidea rubescens DSM 1968]ODV64111.1 hypothetical protein ASCRUDRAFT_68135 [Ascoidea rubescens DSM 1968]